jgi:hypothetical protein
MTPNEFLAKLLQSQDLKPDGEELKALQSARAGVEEILRSHFVDCKPTIRYGGSKAKGTMNLDDYDLDVICYFTNDAGDVGETLEEIFNNVRLCLEKQYNVVPRTTALRLKNKDGDDFHVDVVPGRFTDNTKTDAYLHQNGGNKERLKTNLQTHIDHIAKSGCTDIIRLNKLWRLRSGVSILTFPLELLTIEILRDCDESGLEERFIAVLTAYRDDLDSYTIEDPANPVGNDLSELLSESVRTSLSTAARSTLATVDSSGWEAVFGSVEKSRRSDRTVGLRAASVQMVNPTRPWSNGR